MTPSVAMSNTTSGRTVCCHRSRLQIRGFAQVAVPLHSILPNHGLESTTGAQITEGKKND